MTPADLITKLENYYDFQCEGGPLKNCLEWRQLKASVLAALPLWVLTQWNETRTGTGIRGIYRTNAAALAAIAALIQEHPDLTRADFVIEVQRVRESDSTGQPETPAPDPRTALVEKLRGYAAAWRAGAGELTPADLERWADELAALPR